LGPHGGGGGSRSGLHRKVAPILPFPSSLSHARYCRDTFLLPFLEMPAELTSRLRAQAQQHLRAVEGKEEEASAGEAADGASSTESDDDEAVTAKGGTHSLVTLVSSSLNQLVAHYYAEQYDAALLLQRVWYRRLRKSTQTAM
jgi:hypothetical protein